MAMTYEESAALMMDGVFRGRVKVACLKFANFIFAEAPTEPAHNTRTKWAHRASEMPDQVAAEVTPLTVMDTAVQDAGATIADAALQGAVETSVNKML